MPLSLGMKKTDRYRFFINYFLKHRPGAETELVYDNPYQLLVAVILSAQCTDKRVNLVTPEFFSRFPSPKELSVVEPDVVFDYIKSISYPNNKAKHLVGMARLLLSEFNGKVPDTVDDLQKLPGVGRKTANVVASVVFDIPAMPVDTHVFRVSARIGLVTNAKNPLETEKQLVKNLPENLLSIAHHWLILHGRYVCQARKPLCTECGLTPACKYYRTLAKKIAL
jgi:endonuclease III